jgi:peptidase E
MPREPQILACSGVVDPARGVHPLAQVQQAAALAETGHPRVCYLGTAMGDQRAALASWYGQTAMLGDLVPTHLELFPRPNVADVRDHLLAQDVLWVGNGSVVNLLAVWRAHGLAELLTECWQAGVVLAGEGAGSLCWYGGCIADARTGEPEPLTDGLGLLPYANAVHVDRSRLHMLSDLVAHAPPGADLRAGHATEEGVALHYVGTTLADVLTVLPDRVAYCLDGETAGDADTAVEVIASSAS